jgi:hypothetical protein
MELYCHLNTDGICLDISFVPEIVKLYGEQLPIWKILVEELPKEIPGCYWAWWNNEEGGFSIVDVEKPLVTICFPYGYRIEEERGIGILVPVKVTLISIYKDA